MQYCDNCEKLTDHLTMKCPYPKKGQKRKVKPAAKPPDSISVEESREAVIPDKEVDALVSSIESGSECPMCGDRALKAHLAKKFDRKSYMRDYMKQRREKQRGKE